MSLLLLAFLLPTADAGPMDKLLQKVAGVQTAATYDDLILKEVARARAAAEAAPTEMSPMYAWLASLHSAATAGLHTRGKLSLEADVAPALAAIETFAATRADTAAALQANAARLLWELGEHEQAGALAVRSYQAWPSPDALELQLAWVMESAPTTLATTCKSVRAAAKTDIQRFNVLDQCFLASGAADVATGLAWASATDRSAYSTQKGAMLERDAARAAERAANAPSFPAPSAPAPSSAASPSSSSSSTSGPTSVSAHISCSPKVRVYRGSSSGSGTYGWESSNSTVSYSVRKGEQVCVADASDHRGACWTASGQPHVNLDISCGGVSQR